ncbi:MAG: FHA domain-containing protein [Thermoflexales bacterium]|nr:FHA domain-containing protein [Thermoflexales bacterium]
MTIAAILQVQLARGGTDEHPLARAEINLGRAPDNDVILDDPQVSGHHARLNLTGSTVTLMDLGSLNGISVNGQRIPPRTSVELNPGDAFQIDEFTFRLRPSEPGALPPVSSHVKISSTPIPGLVAYVEGKLLKFPFDKAPLYQATLSLGRAPENDLVIPSSYVSRQHARIERQGEQYVILDSGGRNGLTVGGARILRHVLADGDMVTIGGREVSLQFRDSLGFVSVAGKAPASKPLAVNLKGRDTISIGRAGDNQIVLDHPQVSRHHALLERRGARYRLRDLKSSNGVFVNGKRIEKEAWLNEGDEIRIGSVKLILREDGIQQFTDEGLRLDVLRLNKWVAKDKNLLQDISLCLYPQEFVALVGMSGSGKSTLMDAINGFRPASHGRVTVNGVDLYSNFDLFRNDTGYVPQKDIVHQELTVYSALDYAAQLRMPADTAAGERHKRIVEVMGDLDLAERKDLPIHKLSGGQLKRVSIGVELLTKPRLFFLDEPTSGLDPGTEFEMMKLLRRLADQGRTIMLITHATKNVMMCDKVIFLARGGHMAYFGPPEAALPYFDQFRTEQERRQKDIEFDDIYRILSDEKRGTAQEWDERYRQSAQYHENVTERLEGHPSADPSRSAPSPSKTASRKPATTRHQAGIIRQFLILSARNLKIMVQDKFGLALMLALAPIIGMMDFMWGTDLFDLQAGDATRIITMLFMAGLISILVGAMASVREIVKEVDIYRRERAINLKLSSYILSKVWVGVTLSIYQAVVLLIFKYLFVLHTSPLGPLEYGLLLVTAFIGTLSGYLMGLGISAAAPNQNVALLLVIVILVPQFMFAGALLPLDLISGGEIISRGTSTRWAFEAMVNITGIGRDVVNDPCWQYVEREGKQPGDLSQEQKTASSCSCMGQEMFEACHFPGIRNPEFYTANARAALAAPRPTEPLKPTSYPTPTPLPTPTPIPAPADPGLMEKYQQERDKQAEEYAKRREEQGRDYELKRVEQGDEYASAMKRYGDERERWQREREKAISAAENTIKAMLDNYGRTFKGDVLSRWLAMGAIMTVVFLLVIVFQKRKDVV